MDFAYNLVLGFHIVVGIVIIGLVLIQHGKGADMGAAFGSGSAGSRTGHASGVCSPDGIAADTAAATEEVFGGAPNTTRQRRALPREEFGGRPPSSRRRGTTARRADRRYRIAPRDGARNERAISISIAAYGPEKPHEKNTRGVRGWFSLRMRSEKWGGE